MFRSSPRVLFVASECAPLVKTGGLGDVAGALPHALVGLGSDVRILLPAYRGVSAQVNAGQAISYLPPWAQFPRARLLEGGTVGGVPLLLLDCPELFDRDGGPYQNHVGLDWSDNALRFGQLSRAAFEICRGVPSLEWRPEVIHCNDWQTGLVPAYLRFGGIDDVHSVFTVHNIAFQGVFPADLLTPLGLPPESFSIQGLEYHGQISFLKSGIHYSDVITTVSPAYAAEILHEPLGMGLQGLLAERKHALTGILNGIDDDVWDPARDIHLARRYDAHTLAAKKDNRRALQQRFGLSTVEELPVFATVCRLGYQKGIDLIIEAADYLLSRPAQLVVCGTGDPGMEAGLQALKAKYPEHVGIFIGYDEILAHMIEGGADAFLMPSRFEPCGMNQMYSQRYGTIPIVHATGGLADSVTDATAETLDAGTATGFVFRPFSRETFCAAIDRAVLAFRTPEVWRAMQRAGMRRDFSWATSATRYQEIYRQISAR